MKDRGTPLVWIRSEVKSPPFSEDARLAAGLLLRRLQDGDLLSMPRSRPMPVIGKGCHELRIPDVNGTWRIIYRIDPDAIIIVEVFEKRTQKTPKQVIANAQRRLRWYDETIS